ncbi:hypothetical protein [uncultured Pontibacter sp.]|uniref:hypothetical protein n=1 Tax=uncultured Pontibacter sp. TaxID=453356 RepID=UPI0026243093|nr:hypothetical protein [uncultured Pontibacter sp.]
MCPNKSFYRVDEFVLTSKVDSIDHKSLKKANGDVFFEVRRSSDNAFIIANWVGIQSLETIVMGGNHILAMLRERPCQGLLNSNRELIGPWEVAVNWLAYKWAPQAKTIGLRYYAHVLSPGIYGKRSFDAVYPSLKSNFNAHAFESEDAAEVWLQSKCF